MITLENISELENTSLTDVQQKELIELARLALENRQSVRDFDERFGILCEEKPPYTTQFG